MPDSRANKKHDKKVHRVKLTARVTLVAYDAITDIQRQHRRTKGGFIPLWKVVDAAIRAYAKRQGVTVGE